MPRKPVIRIFDAAGTEVMRMGDVGGMPWGGADYTLPSGYYGTWTRRDGAWMKGQVTMFYAFLGETSNTYDPAGGLLVPTPWIHTSVIDWDFGAGTIIVPRGRIISWEFVYLFSQLSFNSGPVRLTPINRLAVAAMRASRNGAAVTDFKFLTGPATSGEDQYTSVRLRLTIESSDTTFVLNQTINVTIRVKGLLRMFAHELNAPPTASHASDSTSTGASTTDNTEADRDTSGGEGGLELPFKDPNNRI